MKPHPYRLRPYHNPENVDESKVPDGWRFLYADEFPLPPAHGRPCMMFVEHGNEHQLSNLSRCTGSIFWITYIVPVNA